MSDILSGLAQGLRGFGAVANPNVYQAQRQEEEAALNRDQRKQELLFGVIVNGVQSGAIDPDNGRALLSKLDPSMSVPIGPSVAAQKTQADVALEAQRTQARNAAKAKAFGGPEVVKTPDPGTGLTIENGVAVADPVEVDKPAPVSERQLVYANELIQSGDPDLVKEGTDLLKALREKEEKVSGLGLLQRERDQAAARYGEDSPVVKRYDAAIDKETRGPARNAQFEELPTGRTVGGKPEFQKYQIVGQNEDGTAKMVPVGKPSVKTSIVDVNVGQMNPADAAKTELLNQGISDMEEFKKILMPNGEVDYGVVVGLNAPGFAGVPGTDSRTAYSLIYNAVEAKLRAESGAAVPDSEVKRMAARFIPSPLDNEETIKSKVDRMEAFLRGSYSRIKGAGPAQTKPIKTEQTPQETGLEQGPDGTLIETLPDGRKYTWPSKEAHDNWVRATGG